jgi:DNA-3-methyladenine glycosylase I
MMVQRCQWAEGDQLMTDYHDHEWGVPVRDSRALFAKLVLDGFQAGLSWRTILHKRSAFLEAFQGFDPDIVAQFGAAEVESLLANSGIVRSKTKIAAAIGNAQAYLTMTAAGEDLATLVWDMAGGQPIKLTGSTVPAQTSLSEKIAAALRQRGFKFVGPVIVYAWMQAVGIVNDHSPGCFRRDQVARNQSH